MNYGRLKEPVQFINQILRAFNARSANGGGPSDGYLNPQSSNMGQDVWKPTSVFSYYPSDYLVPDTTDLSGPEFGILSATTALRRANFVNTMTFNSIGTSTNAPSGTSLDLSKLQALAGEPRVAGHGAQPFSLARHNVSGNEGGDHHGGLGDLEHQHAAARAAGALSGGDVLSIPGTEVNMDRSRRDFLIRTSCAALGAAALSSGLKKFGLISAMAETLAPTDYRALVCIFLSGGNDGNNMIVPLTGTQNTSYTSARSSSGLALDGATLHSITPPSIGDPFGLHASMPELQTLFDDHRLAVVCNVGPLVQPITRQEYKNGAPRPYQLFSHSDQVAQWQTSRADTREHVGWGGRAGDMTLAFNNGSAFPIVTSLAGQQLFGIGLDSNQLSISGAPTPLNQVLVLSGFSGSSASIARRTAMDAIRGMETGRHDGRRLGRRHAAGHHDRAGALLRPRPGHATSPAPTSETS